MDESGTSQSNAELLERISQLEKLVGVLAAEIKRVERWMNDGDRMIMEHIELVERDKRDAFERIKNIEFKVFPGLSRDILNLTAIIGEGEGKAYNPLDHRKP